MKKKSFYTYLKGSCDLSVCKAVQSQVCVFGDCVGMVNSIHSLWHEDGLLLEIVKTMNSDDLTAKKIVDLIIKLSNQISHLTEFLKNQKAAFYRYTQKPLGSYFSSKTFPCKEQ